MGAAPRGGAAARGEVPPHSAQFQADQPKCPQPLLARPPLFTRAPREEPGRAHTRRRSALCRAGLWGGPNAATGHARPLLKRRETEPRPGGGHGPTLRPPQPSRPHLLAPRRRFRPPAPRSPLPTPHWLATSRLSALIGYNTQQSGAPPLRSPGGGARSGAGLPSLWGRGCVGLSRHSAAVFLQGPVVPQDVGLPRHKPLLRRQNLPEAGWTRLASLRAARCAGTAGMGLGQGC